MQTFCLLRQTFCISSYFRNKTFGSSLCSHQPRTWSFQKFQPTVHKRRIINSSVTSFSTCLTFLGATVYNQRKNTKDISKSQLIGSKISTNTSRKVLNSKISPQKNKSSIEVAELDLWASPAINDIEAAKRFKHFVSTLSNIASVIRIYLFICLFI